MNQSETDSVKDLAKDTVEVLGVVTERECPQCKGAGEYIVDIGGPGIENSESCTEYCSKCSSTGKVKWTWEPRMGEWCICASRLRLIIDLDYNEIWFSLDEISSLAKRRIRVCRSPSECIPILHWEEIERVLEGVGWSKFMFRDWTLEGVQANSGMIHSNQSCSARGKSRQEAVMKAVIQLGEVINAPEPRD